MADLFLRADTDAGPIWACVSPGAHHVVPCVGDRRLSASLRPYRSEDAARAALIAAGGRGVEREGAR